MTVTLDRCAISGACRAWNKIMQASAPERLLAGSGGAGTSRTGAGQQILRSHAALSTVTDRKLYEVAEATGSPVAAEALRRIGELYVVEARVRGQSSRYEPLMSRIVRGD